MCSVKSGGGDLGPGFEEGNAHAGLGEFLGGPTAGGAGADNDGVEILAGQDLQILLAEQREQGNPELPQQRLRIDRQKRLQIGRSERGDLRARRSPLRLRNLGDDRFQFAARLIGAGSANDRLDNPSLHDAVALDSLGRYAGRAGDRLALGVEDLFAGNRRRSEQHEQPHLAGFRRGQWTHHCAFAVSKNPEPLRVDFLAGAKEANSRQRVGSQVVHGGIGKAPGGLANPAVVDTENRAAAAAEMVGDHGERAMAEDLFVAILWAGAAQ
jgi:hypothetical protein